jgi:hypothetical protein
MLEGQGEEIETEGTSDSADETDTAGPDGDPEDS